MQKIFYDIVVATYNGQNFIEDQILSIIDAARACEDQYTLDRLIVSDDNSNDGTQEILARLAKTYPFITLVQNAREKKGVIGNFDNAASFSRADYVFFSDQDDIWLPQKIKITLDHLLAREHTIGKASPILAFTNLDTVTTELAVLRKRNSEFPSSATDFRKTIYRSYGQGCTMLVNRALLTRALPFSNELVMHDWWMLLVASFFGAVVYVPESTVLYRQHANNVVGSKPTSFTHKIRNYRKQIEYLNKVSIQAEYFLLRYSAEINADPALAQKAISARMMARVRRDSFLSNVKKLLTRQILTDNYWILFRFLTQISLLRLLFREDPKSASVNFLE